MGEGKNKRDYHDFQKWLIIYFFCLRWQSKLISIKHSIQIELPLLPLNLKTQQARSIGFYLSAFIKDLHVTAALHI